MGSSLLTPTHLVLLLVAALLLFGAKRLPEVGRSLGTGMREFKDSVSGGIGEIQSELPPPSATEAVAAVAVPEAAVVSSEPAAAERTS
jgi:sec-independent protein translocase protein TatA